MQVYPQIRHTYSLSHTHTHTHTSTHTLSHLVTRFQKKITYPFEREYFSNFEACYQTWLCDGTKRFLFKVKSSSESGIFSLILKLVTKSGLKLRNLQNFHICTLPPSGCYRDVIKFGREWNCTECSLIFNVSQVKRLSFNYI